MDFQDYREKECILRLIEVLMFRYMVLTNYETLVLSDGNGDIVIKIEA